MILKGETMDFKTETQLKISAEDSEFLVEAIDRQIDLYTGFTGFFADGRLAQRIAEAIEREFIFVPRKGDR